MFLKKKNYLSNENLTRIQIKSNDLYLITHSKSYFKSFFYTKIECKSIAIRSNIKLDSYKRKIHLPT